MIVDALTPEAARAFAAKLLKAARKADPMGSFTLEEALRKLRGVFTREELYHHEAKVILDALGGEL